MIWLVCIIELRCLFTHQIMKACGCPVISSNRTSIPEIAGNGAIFIDPDNIEEIKIAVKRLLNDKLLSNSLRKRGLSRAKLFSWKKTRRETFQVYKRFL